MVPLSISMMWPCQAKVCYGSRVFLVGVVEAAAPGPRAPALLKSRHVPVVGPLSVKLTGFVAQIHRVGRGVNRVFAHSRAREVLVTGYLQLVAGCVLDRAPRKRNLTA